MPDGPLRFLLYGDAGAVACGLALMAGALASLLWLRRGASAWVREVRPLSRRAFGAGVVLALVASAAGLWLQAAAMGETGMDAMAKMAMPLPDNTLPMMTGTGPYGPIGMGGV